MSWSHGFCTTIFFKTTLLSFADMFRECFWPSATVNVLELQPFLFSARDQNDMGLAVLCLYSFKCWMEQRGKIIDLHFYYCIVMSIFFEIILRERKNLISRRIFWNIGNVFYVKNLPFL